MTQRISTDDVLHVARLARLELGPEELQSFTLQLGAILDHAADLDSLDLDGVEPTTHPLPLSNVLRPDEIGPTLDRAEVLAAAPAVEGERADR